MRLCFLFCEEKNVVEKAEDEVQADEESDDKKTQRKKAKQKLTLI